MEKREARSGKMIMEKGSHTFFVDNDCFQSKILIESDPFVVGGYSFKIHFYPDSMHTTIKNLSPEPVYTFYDNLIIDGRSELTTPSYYTSSSSNERRAYKRVIKVMPGDNFAGKMNLTSSRLIESRDLNLMTGTGGGGGGDGDGITIRVTIGVFHRGVPFGLEFERCILFHLGTCKCFNVPKQYYAEEAVVRRRCPALLDNFVISDVDPSVFEGVLWFIYNHQLHECDRNRSRAPEMLAAADKFGFKDLTTQCESFISFGDSEVLAYSFQGESRIKKFCSRALTKLSRKMREKMKLD